MIKQLLVTVFVSVTSMLAAQNEVETLNDDGAWCWFADPRAIYHKGEKEQTYFSWVNSKGDIVVASYNHQTGALIENTLHKSFQVDDHANPSVFIRNDGRIMVFYGAHFGDKMYCAISKNVEDISSFNDPVTFGSLVTYPNPFYVNGSIYCFFRGGNSWHPYVCISDDNGLTWSTQHLVIAGGGQRPYTKYIQDKAGGIHIAFTHGHPRQESNNKIYYVYFKDGNFYGADGTFIKEFDNTNPINIDAGDPEVVYDASAGKGWIWDVTVDENNYPVMVYAVFPSDTDHRYYYSRWNGTSWVTNEICKGGGWFPQTPLGATEPEPNYSGGIIMDGDNPNVVYLSKPVNDVFEIWKYTTTDLGETWDSVAITENTPAGLVNVRPFVPRNHKKGFFDVLWMRGTYEFYTDYHTSIVYQSTQEKHRGFDFGIEGNEVSDAYNRVSATTMYTYDFGFPDTTGLEVSEDTGGSGYTKDYVFSDSSASFKSKLLNGEYKLTITQGHSSQEFDSMQMVINQYDTIKNINTISGNWSDTSVTVNITEKMLEIEFSDQGGNNPYWMVNALKLETIEIYNDSIELDTDSIGLVIGEEYDFNVKYYPFLSDSKDIVWAVEDSALISIDNGRVTARQSGISMIYATSSNGNTDSCLVHVEEPVYLDSAYFDFGTPSSPNVSEAYRITENTALGKSYGWLDLTGLQARDRANTDWAKRDLIFGPNETTFRVYLNNGTYPVVITQGDASYAHDMYSVYANGNEVVSSVSNAPGEYIVTEFETNVTDGILDFTFTDNGGSDGNWVVNAIKIGINDKLTGIATNTKDWKSSVEYFTVIDVIGRVVLEKIYVEDNQLYLPKNLNRGVYFISYYDKGGRLLKVRKTICFDR